MKRRNILIVILLLAGLVLLLVLQNFIASSIHHQIPKSLIGEWSCKQKIMVRSKENGKYKFTASPDSVIIHFMIADNGRVTGNIGMAAFEDCSVLKNAGWINRFINFSTDYMLHGKISGTIFFGDPVQIRGIRCPFHKIKDNSIDATIFQSKGLDIYPMAEVHLVRQGTLQ